jgi:hypothetical protein
VVTVHSATTSRVRPWFAVCVVVPVIPARTLLVALAAVVPSLGCSASEDGEPRGTTTNLFSGTDDALASDSEGEKPTAAASAGVVLATNVDKATMTHPEVVQLVMPGKDGDTWFCTGALVAPTVVVTAAHCLQPDLFLSWEVDAPTLASHPRVKGTPRMYDTRWKDVGSPDLGIVRLEKAIALPRYAELTDVTSKVDAGAALSTAAIVRTEELPRAPFKKTGELALSSTVALGYTHGYGVPMYSRGGDSGAGLFLVEAGQMTHKLVGVEREPDPARGLDHLSRVDAAFIRWVGANGN